MCCIRCNPFKTWHQIYTYDPQANFTTLSLGMEHNESAQLVIGGEVTLWMEQTDAVNLDTKPCLRAAPAAEVLWSCRYNDNGHEHTIRVALSRLLSLRHRLLSTGNTCGTRTNAMMRATP